MWHETNLFFLYKIIASTKILGIQAYTKLNIIAIAVSAEDVLLTTCTWVSTYVYNKSDDNMVAAEGLAQQTLSLGWGWRNIDKWPIYGSTAKRTEQVFIQGP